MKVRRRAAVYFALQGLAVVAWWITLFLVPASRKYFQLESDSDVSLLAFWLADLMFAGGGSLAAAWFCREDSRHASAAAWFVAGAVGYATFYCLAYSLSTGAGWLGATLMLPATVWSGCFAIGVSSAREAMFRQARDSSTVWILAKTFGQIVVVWSLILAVFPYLIVLLEDELSVARFAFPLQKLAAGGLFVAASVLGVASAWTMARVGRGTPLPLDATTKLVVRGTYAHVRNPMAVAGIGQGLAVAVFLGSPLTFVYALMGAFIWQFIFRPLEEADLQTNFGADYENYRRNVRCWIPHRRAFRLK